MDQWLETKQLPVHFVSAAGVVYQDGKVLLIRSERRGWEFPGGIVEQGEALLDGLRREIFEESGIAAEPEAVTGIYQNLARKKGFGPLEGMTLPTTVGWFTPDEAMRIIRYPYMKKAFEDAHRYSGKPHFVTFRKADRDIAFISDCMI